MPLRLLAGLLRDAPRGNTSPRLRWREVGGAVRASAIDRPLVVGRDAACDVTLAGARVSRRHCVVRPFGPAGIELEDLQSSAGTFVNGVRLPAGVLRDGDVIETGGVALSVMLDRGSL